MFYDRWSTKVQLPLGPKWGNNIGGVAACLSWAGGRPPKDQKFTKNEDLKLSKQKYNYLRSNLYKKDPEKDYDIHKSTEDRYIQIVPWQDDVGMSRDPGGNLVITGRTTDRNTKDNFREDLMVGAVHDVARKHELEKSANLPPRPPTVTRKNYRAGAGYRSNATATHTKKGYGFMGPPPTPPRHMTTTSKYQSTRSISRPQNPSPDVFSTKYTERELIIEDLDDFHDIGGRKTPVSYRNGVGSRAASTSGYRSVRSTTPHHYNFNQGSLKYRPPSSIGGARVPAATQVTTYEPEVTMDNFSPTPLMLQYDKSIPAVSSGKLDNTLIPPYRHYNANSNNNNSNNNNSNNNNSNYEVVRKTPRPKTAGSRLGATSAGQYGDIKVNVGTMGHKVTDDVQVRPGNLNRSNGTRSSAENITIHVDCSKLVNTARPASLTLRLHGVDAADTNNIRINSVPTK